MVLTEEKLKAIFPKAPPEKIKAYGPVFGKACEEMGFNTPKRIAALLGQIYLQPTKTAEFIYLDFNILPTGATFPA